MTRHHDIARRPVPALPGQGPLAPNFAPLPLPTDDIEPPVRPLYWWIDAAGAQGSVLHGMYFNNLSQTAVVRMRLESYRVIEVTRDATGLASTTPNTLAALIAETVWRLGSAGWSDEIAHLCTLLRNNNILGGSGLIPLRGDLIPHMTFQPDLAVRVAYWWARELLTRGWILHACGQDIAGGGFIATVPTASSEPVLALYPSGMRPDGTEAALLANWMPRLGAVQLRVLQRLVDETAAAVYQGRVI